MKAATARLQPFSEETNCCFTESLSEWLRDQTPATIRHAARTIAQLGYDSESGKQRRQSEYAAGRTLARELLTYWDESSDVPSAKDRSPNWPTGFAGSISHSNHWVWVAVAQNELIRSIGIDTEQIVDPRTRYQTQAEIATDAEWALTKSLGLSAQAEFTLLFSAKEAFYKCLYPIHKQYFNFKQAVVEFCTEGHLIIRPTKDNPIFGQFPDSLDVHYFMNTKNVFTIAWLGQSNRQSKGMEA